MLIGRDTKAGGIEINNVVRRVVNSGVSVGEIGRHVEEGEFVERDCRRR
jgi:hypothetical protein